MPEVILNCPQCQRQLRVTEDLIGRPVKCPACGLTFTVPAGGEAQPLTPVPVAAAPSPEQRPQGPDEAYYQGQPAGGPGPWEYPSAGPDSVKGLVLPPAIGLLITGALGVLFNLGQVLAWLGWRDAMIRATANNPLFKGLGGQGPPGDLEVLGPAVLFGAVSVVVLVAAIQMLRLRAYGFAMAGAILALINAGNCCCLLGLPFGIWALVVLARSDVRAMFH